MKNVEGQLRQRTRIRQETVGAAISTQKSNEKKKKADCIRRECGDAPGRGTATGSREQQ